MKDIWIEIDPVRPRHGASHRIDSGVGEGLVVDRCEHPDKRAGKVGFAHEIVRKRLPKHSAADMLDIGHLGQDAHTCRLLERLDTQQRGWHLGHYEETASLTIKRGTPSTGRGRVGCNRAL